MAKKDYVDPNDSGFGVQLSTFEAGIGGFPTLGVTPAQIASQSADAKYFNFAITCQNIRQDDAKQWTAWKNLLRAGGVSGVTSPVTTALPTAVPAVDPGIEPRYRALVKQIKGRVVS